MSEILFQSCLSLVFKCLFSAVAVLANFQLMEISENLLHPTLLYKGWKYAYTVNVNEIAGLAGW